MLAQFQLFFPGVTFRSRPRALALRFLVILLGLFLVADVFAQRPGSRHARVRKTVLRVALQPFTFDTPVKRTIRRTLAPRSLRVAYYSPSVIRRGQPVDEAAYYLPRRVPRARPPQGAEEYDAEPFADEEEDDGRPANFDRDEENEAPRMLGGSRPTVAGNRAVLRNGVAYAPANAPDRVKAAIWAANTLRRKPYRWGGGHGSFQDSGYDCSGTVSFALHHAGALRSPLPSSSFMNYGERGRGRWITVYSRRGHTFAVIAGLRLDTTDFRGGRDGPRWHADGRSTSGYVARHPTGL